MSTTPVILMLSYEKTKQNPDLKLDSTLIGKGFEEQGEDNRKIFSHLIRSQCIVVIFRYFVHNKYNEHTKSYVLESLIFVGVNVRIYWSDPIIRYMVYCGKCGIFPFCNM